MSYAQKPRSPKLTNTVALTKCPPYTGVPSAPVQPRNDMPRVNCQQGLLKSGVYAQNPSVSVTAMLRQPRASMGTAAAIRKISTSIEPIALNTLFAARAAR